MLWLPNITIERNEMAEVKLTQRVKAYLEKEDESRTPGIHASDLLDPRKAYWSWAVPQELTERQTWMFMIGKVLHSLVLVSCLDGELGTTDAGTRQELGVSFSPDRVTYGSPVELKTNRTPVEPSPDKLLENFHHYFEQLCVYMVFMDSRHGELWVLFLNLRDASNRTFPEPRCYHVSITDEQHGQIKERVLQTRDHLTEAKATRNPSTLPLCRAWLCGDGTCPWWNNCKPEGRYGRTRREWLK